MQLIKSYNFVIIIYYNLVGYVGVDIFNMSFHSATTWPKLFKVKLHTHTSV